MSKSLNLFWWYWLIGVTAGVVGFGLALVLTPNLMHRFFNWWFFSASKTNASLSDPATSYLAFTYGVLGAVMVGWAVALFAFLLGPFRRGEREGWYSLTFSIIIWFGLDSVLSLVAGFFENAILNAVFLLLFAVPLGATYRYFRYKP